MSANFIEFGKYPYTDEGEYLPIKWRVLNVSGHSMLIISEFGIDTKAFYEAPAKPLSEKAWKLSDDDPNSIYSLKKNKSPKIYDINGIEYRDINGVPITNPKYKGFPKWYKVTWENSTLRSYLNGIFFETSFTRDEKSKIKKVNVKNEHSPINEAVEGGSNTIDNVFLLDYENIKRYFPTEEDRRCFPTPFAKKNGAFEHLDGHCSWWTRTVGLWEQFNPKEDYRPPNKHCMSVVWNDGIIDLMGMSAETLRCIRPTMLIKI